MKRFCPECGVTDDKKTFVNGFCIDCYPSKEKLIELPKEIKVEYCKNCRKIVFKGKLLTETPALLESIVLKHLKLSDQLDARKIIINFSALKEETLLVSVKANCLIDSKPVMLASQTILRFKKTHCNDCNKLKSNYHECVIQVRFKDKQEKSVLQKVLRKLESRLQEISKTNALATVVKIEYLKNGFDASVGSKKAGKKAFNSLKKSFQGKVKYSTTLVGEKNGKRIYRETYCLKINQ
ncbi:MAG: NMD3-related protein [archaeon]